MPSGVRTIARLSSNWKGDNECRDRELEDEDLTVARPGVLAFIEEYEGERVCVRLVPFIFGIYPAPSSGGMYGSARSRRSVTCFNKRSAFALSRLTHCLRG